jgi:CopG family nickel-responsive transcriptional regulator
MMSDMVRFGVSMSAGLLKSLDDLLGKIGYKTRSEAIRDMVRSRLVEQEWADTNREVVGTITLVYSHEVRELTETLTAMQHHYTGEIVSTTHIHLDEHNCLEVLIVRGRSKRVREIADRLISTRGVKHGQLTTTTTGTKLG